MNTNAMRLHLRKYGTLAIALRHPQLFDRFTQKVTATMQRAASGGVTHVQKRAFQ